MDGLSERLKRGVLRLEQFDQKRIENTMTPEDYDEEYGIVITELWDLEEEIARDPGALQPYLVRVPRPGEPTDRG